MARKDANKKHYFSVIPETESKEMLEDITENGISFHMWEKGQTEKDLEEFEPILFDDNSFKLNLKKIGGMLATLTQSKLTGKDVFFRISRDGYQFFSWGELSYNATNSQYALDCSHDVYKSQQRTNYRLMASQFIKIQIKIGDDVFDGMDISAGGSSFKISEEHLDRYPKQKTFDNCVLHLNRKNFDIPHLKVMSIWDDNNTEHKPTGFKNLGVAFIDLPKALEEELFVHINSEARAEEMTKKMRDRKK